MREESIGTEISRRQFVLALCATIGLVTSTKSVIADTLDEVPKISLDQLADICNEYSDVDQSVEWVSGGNSIMNNINLLFDVLSVNQLEDWELFHLFKILQDLATGENPDVKEAQRILFQIIRYFRDEGYFLNLKNAVIWWKLLQKWDTLSISIAQDENLKQLFWDTSQISVDAIMISDTHAQFAGLADMSRIVVLNSANIRARHDDYQKYLAQVQNPIFSWGVTLHDIQITVASNEMAHIYLDRIYWFNDSSKINWKEEVEKKWIRYTAQMNSDSIWEFISDTVALVWNKYNIIVQLGRLFLPQILSYGFSKTFLYITLRQIFHNREDNAASKVNEVLDIIAGNTQKSINQRDALKLILESLREEDMQFIVNEYFRYSLDFIDIIKTT